jgi:phage terminase small subunit
MNIKQMEFVEHYLVNANAKEAYQIVFPKSSYKTATVNGYKLLNTIEVKEYIQQKQKELADKCTVKKVDIVNVLAIIMNDANAKNADRIKAGEVLLKALGYNAPTEQNINLNVEQPLFGSNE